MLKAVIFDYNGVLVDDERIHMELFQEILADHKVGISEDEYFARYLALCDRDVFTEALSANGVKIKRGLIDKLIRRKNQRYLEVVADRSILFPRARDVVESFAIAYPIGIVSGALRAEIETVLAREEMTDQFAFVVAAQDVTRGKPDPEGLVVALNQMNHHVEFTQLPVQPSECLVVEDSPAGIAAARSIGMKCIGLATSRPAADLAMADLVYGALEEIRMDDVRDLFADPRDRGATDGSADAPPAGPVPDSLDNRSRRPK
jgi:beta-phosphoglucomutase-like phosphatase (HAD superfamily)